MIDEGSERIVFIIFMILFAAIVFGISWVMHVGAMQDYHQCVALVNHGFIESCERMKPTPWLGIFE